MATAFVTGGTGFVGAALVRALLADGWRVRALVRDCQRLANLKGMKVDLAPGDLSCRSSLAGLMAGCDALFHVAADYRLWALEPRQIYHTNAGGTARIMHAALDAKIKRIVYTSSVATLGLKTNKQPANEETPVSFASMIGDYKKSKYLAEQEVQRMVLAEGLPAVIVNPSLPVGPGDHRPTASGRMIIAAFTGAMPLVSRTGVNIVHVDDVARGHIQAFDHGKLGQRYILGGDNMSLYDLVRIVRAIDHKRGAWGVIPAAAVLPIAWASEIWARWRRWDHEPLVTVTGTRLAAKNMFFSSQRAERQLHYRHRQANQAFYDAIDWFKKHGYC